MKLQFSEVVGTLATAPQHVLFHPRKLAYVASAGVVVCDVDAKTGKLGSQRLFVANAAQNDEERDRRSGKLENGEKLDKRDAFDFPIEGTYTHGLDKIEAERKKVTGNSGDVLPSKLKDRVRAVSCVALSPNGRVLAVGESGYQPRILLYSLAPNSSSTPFAVIQEHMFGVKHIAFLPDSRYFASLGQLSDGFLHVWKYSATHVTLKAGNKCLSIVNELLWHLLSSIVTAGLRFLKIWTFENHDLSKPVVLKGRNVVLGQNLECDFTEAASLSHDEVLICASHQALYLLSVSSLSMVPIALQESPSELYGLQTDDESNLVCYFEGDSPQIRPLNFLTPTVSKLAPSSPSKIALMFSSMSLTPSCSDTPIVKSYLRVINGVTRLLYLTNKKEIKSYDSVTNSIEPLIATPVSRTGGMKQASNGDLLVYSKCGSIKRVNMDTSIEAVASIKLSQTHELENELTAVDYDGAYAYFGDRYGQLFVVDTKTKKQLTQFKAHSSSINELLHFMVSGIELLCTTSRDRTIQLFYANDGQWELLQTIANHTGNLLHAKVHQETLYVCSADRSISIYGFKPTKDQETPLHVFQKKVLTLKHSPTTMRILEDELHVATNDKAIQVFDVTTSDFKYTVKLLNEKGESLVVENIVSISRYIAISASDRSVRYYAPQYKKELAICWGHADSIVGMVNHNSSLYSIGLCGCLFKWNVIDIVDSSHSSFKEEDSDLSLVDPESLPLLAKVPRKILPVVSESSSMLASQSTPHIRRDTSPSKRLLLIYDPGSPSPAPSTTPRLTNATLKRMEARKSLPAASISKTSSPTPSLSRSSPTRAQSPSRAVRATMESKDLPSKTPSLSSITDSQPRLSPQSGSDSMERATAYISIMKAHALKGLFSTSEKKKLIVQIQDLMDVLGVTATRPANQEALLEKFGEQLVEIVLQKLQNK